MELIEATKASGGYMRSQTRRSEFTDITWHPTTIAMIKFLITCNMQTLLIYTTLMNKHSELLGGFGIILYTHTYMYTSTHMQVCVIICIHTNSYRVSETEPVRASLKRNPPLAKPEPVSTTGCVSVTTYLRKHKNDSSWESEKMWVKHPYSHQGGRRRGRRCSGHWSRSSPAVHGEAHGGGGCRPAAYGVPCQIIYLGYSWRRWTCPEGSCSLWRANTGAGCLSGGVPCGWPTL